MTDDLNDIDPIFVEVVLKHADAFVNVDQSVDQIIQWGERELKERFDKIKQTGGALQELKKISAEVEVEVKQKLDDFEKTIKAQYPES